MPDIKQQVILLIDHGQFFGTATISQELQQLTSPSVQTITSNNDLVVKILYVPGANYGAVLSNSEAEVFIKIIKAQNDPKFPKCKELLHFEGRKNK